MLRRPREGNSLEALSLKHPIQRLEARALILYSVSRSLLMWRIRYKVQRACFFVLSFPLPTQTLPPVQ